MEFQRAMQSIFPKELYPWVQVYIDDILVMANSRQEALQRLEQVLVVLRHHNIKANIRKSELIRTVVHYLGHTIKQGTIAMEPEKVVSILRAPTPTTVTQLRAFLGMTNYYSSFIPRYSSLAAPLYALTGLRNLPPLLPAQLAAIGQLKASIAEMRLLHSYRPGDQFQIHLYSDASDGGIGAVLQHTSRQPIAFYSRKLTPSELNYTIYEKELLALVTACEQWRHILLGAQCTYHVDNQALSYLHANKLTNPRVARWVMRLSYFLGGELDWLAGIDNPVADWLSRHSWDPAVDEYIMPYVLSGED
jgi:hypothetical protein